MSILYKYTQHIYVHLHTEYITFYNTFRGKYHKYSYVLPTRLDGDKKVKSTKVDVEAQNGCDSFVCCARVAL